MLLAADLIAAILDGREQDGLSLETPYRLPVEWEAQRTLLGGTTVR